jgi:hypothetical protein
MGPVVGAVTMATEVVITIIIITMTTTVGRISRSTGTKMITPPMTMTVTTINNIITTMTNKPNCAESCWNWVTAVPPRLDPR